MSEEDQEHGINSEGEPKAQPESSDEPVEQSGEEVAAGKEATEEPEIDIVEAYGAAPHVKKVEYINQLTFKQAQELIEKYGPIPEGYRRLLNNQFEDLLMMCFPDHYYYYKKHNGVYFYEEIFHELEQIKVRIDIKSREPAQKKSLRDTLDVDDFRVLKNFIDAAASDDLSIIEDDIHRIRTYLFSDYLDIIRFCQFANLDFLRRLHLKMKENRLDDKAQREWILIADDVKVLVTGWKEWKKNQGSVNWLKFFGDEVKDILKLGTPGCFFGLLDFLAENRVNVVRHGPYLEELFNTIVQLKRFNLFKMLIEKYKITRYDWFSLMPMAASNGQIAMIERLTDLEDNVRTVDRSDVRFTVMDLSIKNGYIEAFKYFFEQCSDEELKENTNWCQAIIAAISFGDYDFFQFIFNHPLFKLENTKVEFSYAETKDNDKMKDALKQLTKEEHLLQKSLTSDMDSVGSFVITKFLFDKYMKKQDVESFLNMEEEHLNMKKVMYLLSMIGQKKHHLNFYQSFFASETNIRRFFYCFHFKSDILHQKILPVVAMMHQSEYQSSKDALALFEELCICADYFAAGEATAVAIYRIFNDYAATELGQSAKHKEIMGSFIKTINAEHLPSGEELFANAKKEIINSGAKIDPDSNLHSILKIIAVKLGQRPIAIDSFNKLIK